MLPFEEAKKAFDKHLVSLKLRNYPNKPTDIHGITKYHWSKFRRTYPDLQEAPGFQKVRGMFDVYVIAIGVCKVYIPCCCCVQRRVELKPHVQWFMDRFLRRS